MRRHEYILAKIAEEAAELSQRALKALAFTPDEKQPGQDLTNAERVLEEYQDLLGVMEMAHEEGIVPSPFPDKLGTFFADLEPFLEKKKAKVNRYYVIPVKLGAVEGIPADPTYQHPEAT